MLKNKLKRWLSAAVSAVMLCGMAGLLPFSTVRLAEPIVAEASTNGHTADEAIAWCNSNVGQYLYNGQCVGLIVEYYKYLGQAMVYGNAKDYATNSLPAGWQRIAGAQPQKGDILVYTDGEWGHVAIYDSEAGTYHQNYANVQKVQYIPSSQWYWKRSGYWGVIRPDFPDPFPPPPDPDASIASGKYQIVNVGTGNYFNHGYGWRGEKLFYPAIAEPADGSPEQTFIINNVGGITYTVQSGYNSEFMNIWAGTPSEIWLNQYVTFLNASNDNTQRFYFAPVGNGEYVIESAENKKLVFGITVETYNRDFQMIKLQKYNKSDANQRWKFIRLDAPPPPIDPPVDPDPPTVKTDLVYGVDISAFQGDVDWNALEHSGIDFAILRTGTTLSKDNNSEYYWDSRIDKNYAGAKETKLKLGAYYYCGATTEADFINCAYGFLDHIKGKEFEYPVYIDLENDPSGDTTQRDLGKKKLTSYVISALTIIRNRGYRAGVYANLDWFNNYLDADAIKAAGFEIWLAQYPSASKAVDPTQYDKSDFGGMWQYSSLGSINGISGNVDLDVSYIKYDELPPVEAQQVKGDCNDDGSFTIADAVLIHKWLVTIPDVKLANWEAGDMNADGKLDVRDLSLMKQALLKQ